ncbi:unnamed protein product, partial [Mesorhabditis belari]|uniref:C2H2-type domain-containing protein n=1 Tax=Mesorhabditis belari TaxID=2138241 RepID=A0AAF3FM71_9BILA
MRLMEMRMMWKWMSWMMKKATVIWMTRKEVLYGSEDDSMDVPVEGHPTTEEIVDDGEEVSDPAGSNPCPYCRFASNSEEETARHCAQLNRNTIFVCQMCDFGCKWSKNFYEHVRQNHFHMPLYNCAHCPFVSNDRVQDLLAHMLVHSEIRFFKCAQCGFGGPRELKFGLTRSCTLMRPHICDGMWLLVEIRRSPLTQQRNNGDVFSLSYWGM